MKDWRMNGEQRSEQRSSWETKRNRRFHFDHLFRSVLRFPEREKEFLERGIGFKKKGRKLIDGIPRFFVDIPGPFACVGGVLREVKRNFRIKGRDCR